MLRCPSRGEYGRWCGVMVVYVPVSLGGDGVRGISKHGFLAVPPRTDDQVSVKGRVCIPSHSARQRREEGGE